MAIVVVVPGIDFSNSGEGDVPISFSAKDFIKGMELIKEFLWNYKNNYQKRDFNE
jgi:aspartate/methionine/tyrosine aminotransferase